MRQSEGPPPSRDDPFETESRRLTPSAGLVPIPESVGGPDGANEDFLFHLYRGSELLQDNRVHEAKEELERALHLQPRDAKGQDLLAVVYFRLGLYSRAIQIYEQLRRHNEDDASLLLNLALCYLKTGQPALARRDLEQLLAQNPGHTRAWGYLGLACERIGDLVAAERAFAEGGHSQMAQRIAARRGDAAKRSGRPETERASETIAVRPRLVPDPEPREREEEHAAVHELDAGELAFGLADASAGPAKEANGAVPDADATKAGGVEEEEEPAKPDTRDGPPPLQPAVPPTALSQALNRRPTLIAPVGAPPAHEIASEYVALERLPSQRPPSIGFEPATMMPTPSMRRPVVAVPSPFGPAKTHDALPNVHGTRTLPPPLIAPAQDPVIVPPAEEHVPAASIAPSTPLGIGPMLGETRTHETSRAPSVHVHEPRTDSLHFPNTGGVVLHPSGVALVRTTSEIGFAARLESIRAQQSGLKMQLLERHLKGKPNGESFGGVASPMALTTGEGQLVLAARPGRKLAAFAVGGAMCFVREEVLLGFGGGLAFENGKLGTGEGESVPVVQLRGDGSVVLEAIGEILRLTVLPDRSLSVRREVILGWFGRLVPRALPPSDAPCGQRGLVSFAGEGHVLIASS